MACCCCCGGKKLREPTWVTPDGNTPRIAILLSGTRGDHQPAIPFSLAIKDRGMDVKVFSKETFREMFERHGIAFSGAPGTDFEYIFTSWLVRKAMMTGSTTAISMAINQILERSYNENGTMDCIMDGLREFRPTVVIWHMSLVVEALTACRLYNCPGICLAFFPFSPTTQLPCFPMNGGSTWKSGHRIVHKTMWKHFYGIGKCSLLCHTKCKYGLKLGGSDFWRMYSDAQKATLCAWSPSLGPRPYDYHDGVQGPTGFFRMSDEQQVKAFEAPAELKDFVERYTRADLAYIGWGSMGAGTDQRLCQLAVSALMHAGAKGVVQGSYSDLRIEKLTDPKLIAYAESNIYFVHKGISLPHSWLFPLCGVCVHHGGVGTVGACLYAGTPSIVTPVYLDQYYWANCIQEADAGLRGPALASATGKTLGSCISTCLDNLKQDGSMVANAVSLGNRMRSEDGVGKAVDFLEKFCKGEWPEDPSGAIPASKREVK